MEIYYIATNTDFELQQYRFISLLGNIHFLGLAFNAIKTSPFFLLLKPNVLLVQIHIGVSPRKMVMAVRWEVHTEKAFKKIFIYLKCFSYFSDAYWYN